MEPNKRFYWRLGTVIFGSLAAAIAFFFLLFCFKDIKDFILLILSGIRPILVGVVLSYLLCPIAKFLERHCQKVDKLSSFARVISVLLTVLFAFGVLALFCALIIPQLAESVGGLVEDLPGMFEVWMDNLNTYLKSDDDVAATIMQMLESTETTLISWVKTNLFSTVTTLASSVLSIGSTLVNTVVSVIVMVYLLMGREHYMAQCKKLFYSISKNKRFNRIVGETLEQANKIFGGFISGKLIDSLIIGVICFVCLMIMNIPYTLLISVIVGVTNIIPVFGPFIGAVPSAFLLLLVSPGKCIAFLIFIIVLQQIDGNIIGPRILGNSTGLSAFYVMVAMLLFGKLLGFVGMIIGVPLFATLYYIVKRVAEYSLRKQKLPVDTAEYEKISQKNEDEEEKLKKSETFNKEDLDA